MPQDQFLFVNKTARSTSLTNNKNDLTLLKRANNHVQPRSKVKNSKIDSTASRLVGWSQPNQTLRAPGASMVACPVARQSSTKFCRQRGVTAEATHVSSSGSTRQVVTNKDERGRAGELPVKHARLRPQTPHRVHREASDGEKTDMGPPPFDCLADHTLCSCDEKAFLKLPCAWNPRLQPQPLAALGNKRLRSSEDSPAISQQTRTCSNPVAAVSTGPAPTLNEISGALDPFLHLPLELTQRERSLLQFYLTEGIPLIFQTSLFALFSGATYIFSLRSSASANYVVTKVIVTEWLHCTLNGTALSRNFLRRKAEVYRYVNDLVNDQERNLEELLFGLVYLQIMDWTVGNPEIQRMHLQAIDTVLNDAGSMLSILQGLSHYFYPSVVACQYICVDLPLRELSALEQVKNRFFRSLRFIRDWHDNNITNDSTSAATSALLDARQQIQQQGTLDQYLKTLIHRLPTNADDDFASASGSTALLQWLCLTLAYYNQGRIETETYMELLESYLGGASQRCPQSGDLLLHPSQAIAIVAYTSSMVMGQNSGVDNQDIQSRICADCVDGSKMVPYLGHNTRRRLLTGLASVAAGEESSFWASEDMLAEMSAEIATSWWRKNQKVPLEAGP